MPPYLYHPLTLLVSALVVLWCTPLVRTVGVNNGRFDRPAEGQTHALPMVRLAGVSILAGTAVAILPVWRLGGVAEAGGGVLPVGKEYEIWGVTIAGPDRPAAGMSRIAALVIMFASLYMNQPAAALIAAALAGGALAFGKLSGLRSGKSPPTAGKRHRHHCLKQAGVSSRRAILLIDALTLWASRLAPAFSGTPSGVACDPGATVLLSYPSRRAWKPARPSDCSAERLRKFSKSLFSRLFREIEIFNLKLLRCEYKWELYK